MLMATEGRLNAAGLNNASFLDNSHIKKCLKWTKKKINRDLSNVVFIEELSFWAKSSRKGTWTLHRILHIQRAIKERDTCKLRKTSQFVGVLNGWPQITIRSTDPDYAQNGNTKIAQ